jgi:hypothetical protein
MKKNKNQNLPPSLLIFFTYVRRKNKCHKNMSEYEMVYIGTLLITQKKSRLCTFLIIIRR